MSDTLYAPPGTEEFDWPPRGRSAMGAAPRVSPLQSAMQQLQEQRDLYDPTKFVPAEGAVPLTGAPMHQPGALGDFGRQVWASTTQMGEGLLGFVSAANRTMGGDPDMLRLIESARHAVAEHTQSVIESMSPKAQAAMRASLFGGQDRHGNATPSPNEVGWASYAGATVASAIPTVVAALLPGAVIKNAIGAGVATAGLFGAIQSGEAYNSFVTAIDDAKESDLQQSPAYQELRKTMSDTDARKELVSMIAPSLVATQFGIGAATGTGYAHMFGGGITGSLARRAGIGAAEGAALGALQGGGGNLASQRAETQAGLLTDYNPTDAALQGAAGAIGGVLLGGGAGAIAGRRRSAMKDGPSHPVEVPADQAAALAEVGVVEAPRPAPQGEMFLPYEMGAGPRPGEAAGMPTRQPDLFGGPEIQVTEQAPAFPQLKGGDAEDILKFKPDLVLMTSYSRPELVQQVRKTGVQVCFIARFESLEDAYANLRLVAQAVGHPERAEPVIQSCRKRVESLAARLRGVKPVRVLAPSTYGYIAGTDTTFQDLCDHAGALNVAAEAGLKGHAPTPGEQILGWRVEALVLGGTDCATSLTPYRSLTPFRLLPAVQQGRCAMIPGHVLSSVTHLRIDGYERLARQLHPEAFR